MNRLEGKTALITGAARGLGAAIAGRFAEEGATVVINDLHIEAARARAEALGGHALAADVADPAAVKRMFADLAGITDRLDVLVNNAGISGLEGDNEARARIAALGEAASAGAVDASAPFPLTEVDDAAWQRMIGVHLNGTFYCCREALGWMHRQNGGVIINMGSIMGTFGRPGACPYSAAKGGILGFTRALAHEVVHRNVRVNALAPGFIDTDMTAPLAPMLDAIRAMTPMGRLGEPDDIAWAAVYLASDEAKFMTGQVVSPNGGFYMSQ